MQIVRSYLIVILAIITVVIAYLYGGFWCASTFFLLGIIFLLWLVVTERLRFKEPEPHWLCGTPQVVRDEIDEHYSDAVNLVKQNKSVTYSLFEDELNIDSYLAEKIIHKLVEENIITEKTTRIWTLK